MTSMSYNDLKDVEIATLELKSVGEFAIERLLQVIHRHGAVDRVGVRLLHKHHNVAKDEIMLESSFVDEEGFGLRTAPAKATEITSTHIPNSWHLNRGEYVPSEFSHLELRRQAFPTSASTFRLFAEFREVAGNLGVEQILGPALLYSLHVDNYRPEANSIMAETSDAYSRSSILRYASPYTAKRQIETTWAACDPQGSASLMVACTQTCYVYPEGGHSGSTTHVSG